MLPVGEKAAKKGIKKLVEETAKTYTEPLIGALYKSKKPRLIAQTFEKMLISLEGIIFEVHDGTALGSTLQSAISTGAE